MERTDLEERIRELPPELVQEVDDFVELLRNKHREHVSRPPTLEWAGAIKELRDRYTSVELQHELSKWRAPDR